MVGFNSRPSDYRKVLVMKIFTKIFNILAALALAIMVILVFYNAVLRYVFNSSYPPSEELSRIFFIWVTYLGIVVAYTAGGHVAVTLVTDRLKGKVKIVFTVIKYVVMLAIMVVLIVGGIKYTSTCNYNTVATGINYMLVSSSVLVSSLAMFVLMIKDFIMEIKLLFTKREEVEILE